MMHYFEGYQELTRNVAGQKLQNINGLIYTYDVPDLGTPQQLELVFLVKIKIFHSNAGRMEPHLC